jgi:hypothetical protein
VKYDLDGEAIKLKRNALWPTVIHAAEYPQWREDRDRLVALCRRLRERGDSWGIAPRSKAGLFESRPNLFEDLDAAGLVAFCGALIATLFECDVAFPESWCHITNDGGYHDAHAHLDFARAGICGIYYLQCEECTSEPPNGVNRFYSPDPFQTTDVVEMLPQPGKLVLFPGHIRHSALPYRGREDRIVISFNARLLPPAPRP